MYVCMVVVGHTAYDEEYDGEDFYVRFTDGLRAVCVDAAMYRGYKGFLEIGTDGHFRSFEVHGDSLVEKDLTTTACILHDIAAIR
jgi:hypothetical protein